MEMVALSSFYFDHLHLESDGFMLFLGDIWKNLEKGQIVN